MTATCQIRISRAHYDGLVGALFPGDADEHGAVLLAGVSQDGEQPVLHVREVHIAHDGVDYVEGKIGYRALNPPFIHRMITRARDEKLAYVAVHNHGTDTSVGFSGIDLDSHERGYPALLQIGRGMPVGALVMGHRAAQADVWTSTATRYALDRIVVVGGTIKQLTPSPRTSSAAPPMESFDRQVRMFGRAGQARLADCRVAIVGLGGIGSLVAEYLARLGVKSFVLIDPDTVESSNLSRVAGALASDAENHTPKVEVARRVILQGNPDADVITVQDDVAKQSVARRLTAADYVFLAADSMRARLVFNAITHQYLVPGVQLGSKIRMAPDGTLADVMSANRPIRPGLGCLWCNQLIDPTDLAIEAKSDDERRAQAYGVAEPNPSVIALNAIAAAHAVNDFMLDYLGLRDEQATLLFEHLHFAPRRKTTLVEPRRDEGCSECSSTGQRYARADGVGLPTVDG